MQQEPEIQVCQKNGKNHTKKTKKKTPQLVPEVVWFSSPSKKTLPEIADRKKKKNQTHSLVDFFSFRLPHTRILFVRHAA